MRSLMPAKTRPLFVVATLLSIMVLGALLAPEAHARIIICRADPIVWLSDDTKIHLITDISIRPKKVVSIEWILHVSPDIEVERIKYNKGVLGRKEKVTTVQDANPGEFWVETLVVTQKDPVPVTSRAKAINLLTGNKVTRKVAGESGQTLYLVIPHP